MKKKIFSSITIIALLLAMLVGLTACGEKDDDSKKESKTGAKAVVEAYFTNIGKNDFNKAFESIDWPAFAMIQNDLTYSEIEEQYKEFKEENSEEIEQFSDYIKEFAGYFEDEIKEFDTFKVDVKKVGSEKKVEDTKNIYSVEVEVAITYKQDSDSEEETRTETYEVYVMKDGDKYSIINGIDEFMESLF